MTSTQVYIYGGDAELTDVNVDVFPIGGGALVTVTLQSAYSDEVRPDVLFARTEFYPYQENIYEVLQPLVQDVLALFKGLVEAQGGKLELNTTEVGD